MRKSMMFGVLVLFAGYTVASYGWVLLQGWDITIKQWIDPLDAYQWPSGGPHLIPPGQVFPSQTGVGAGLTSFATSTAASSVAAQEAQYTQTTQAQGRSSNPVQSRL